MSTSLIDTSGIRFSSSSSCSNSSSIISNNLLCIDSSLPPSSSSSDSTYNNFSSSILFSSSFGFPDIKTNNLREKLKNVNDTFMGFQDSVALDSRKRRNQNDEKYKESECKINRLQKHLNSEITRRTESTNNLQKVIERMGNEMMLKLSNKLNKRIEKLIYSLDILVKRNEMLETKLAEMKGLVPSKLQADTTALIREIREFGEKLNLSKNIRKDSHNSYLKRIHEFEYAVAAKMEEENAMSEESITQISKEIGELVGGGDSSSENFRYFLGNEMSRLNNALKLAADARAAADDEILQTVSQYNTTLEKSLHIVRMK